MLIAVAGMALVFAGVAFAEYAARDLLLSRGNLLAVQPAPPLLPGQLAVLRPEPLRPRSGPGPGRARRVSGLVARHPAADRRGDRLRASCSAALALSYSITSFVALFAGPAGRRGAAVERSMGARGRAPRSWSAARSSCWPSARGTPTSARREQQHDDRAAGWTWSRGGVELAGRPPGLGLGLGLVRRRVLPPHRTRQDDRLPHRAGHRRGRAGGDRAGRLRGARRPRPDRPVQRRGRLGGERGDGRLLRGDRRPQPRLRGVHDRPGDLGAAGPGRGAAASPARGDRCGAAAGAVGDSGRPRPPRDPRPAAV